VRFSYRIINSLLHACFLSDSNVTMKFYIHRETLSKEKHPYGFWISDPTQFHLTCFTPSVRFGMAVVLDMFMSMESNDTIHWNRVG